ncbi:MAG: serine/threonine-protein phosphatase [Mycoplasmatales bacterium]|nr:serine/threonine-protein phosphatase [Mycoplasmatales bacterium]
MKFTVRTDVGVVRSENQDRAAVFNKDGIILAILCDGMGGHEGGSHASSITIATFEKSFEKNFPSKREFIDKWFLKTIHTAKKAMTVFAKPNRSLLDMGTTVTAALILNDEIKVFNIGDSRTYIYNGLLHQITVDHNLRNYYINKHGYSEEEAATVMGAAALTSALGPKKKTTIDTYKTERNADFKTVILTSDGIHDYISKPNFEKIISTSSASLEERGDVLIRQAIKGKSSDNLTVVIVEVE